ncbi:hypothetical protein GCM10028820_00010 [Tessaracoccus terricola]
MPSEQAWSALTDVERWPAWWQGMAVESMQVGGHPDGVGNRAALLVRSPAGLRLRFTVELTAVEPLRRLAFTAEGDLRGDGEWAFAPDGDGTRMDVTWCVVSRRWPIRVGRPLAAWAHHRIMERGEAGLRRP